MLQGANTDLDKNIQRTIMKLENNSQDPRKVFAGKLIELGIDAQKAYWIALDVGMDAVGKKYLTRWALRGTELKIVEDLIADFYLGRLM